MVLNTTKLNINPVRGDVYECILGNYEPIDPKKPEGPFKKDNYQVRIPNEIRKRRPVVIIGERNKQFLVVPISSKEDTHPKPHRTGEGMKLHIRLDGNEVPVTEKYKEGTVCWAKTDLIQSVDKQRLRQFRLADGSHAIGKVSAPTLKAIQEGVMRAIGLTSLVEQHAEFEKIKAEFEKIKAECDELKKEQAQ